MSILTPLRPGQPGTVADVIGVDPALAGRVTCDADGWVVLSGASGGPAPASGKERRRWELHVLMRIAAELGADAAAGVRFRWRS